MDLSSIQSIMSDGGHFKIDQTTFGAIKEGRQVISSDITKEDKIDTLIAQALNNLTNKQRDTVYHELHGVDNIVEETEEFVASHMEALGTEIDRVKLSHHKGLAYKLAEIISSKYVGDSLFRLKFLRSEKFNVRKCADRMIRFFDCKLHFFGAAKLCDDIALADLDNDDMASLRAGFMQILPVRDQAGRSIFLLLPSLQTYKHIKNMVSRQNSRIMKTIFVISRYIRICKMRVLFYLLVSMVDDKETQKRGGSLIVYHSGKFELKSFDTRTVAQKCWLLDCLPIRTCSLHHCYSDPGFRYTINIEMHFLSEEARARTKLHYGSHNECAHALQTYGVPPDGLPVNMDGELKRRSHLDLIKIRQRQESIAGFPRIVVPTNRDVLFGRGTNGIDAKI